MTSSRTIVRDLRLRAPLEGERMSFGDEAQGGKGEEIAGVVGIEITIEGIHWIVRGIGGYLYRVNPQSKPLTHQWEHLWTYAGTLLTETNAWLQGKD
jgi:hypothetical protein